MATSNISSKDPIQQIPNEIQDMIIELLAYQDAIMLSQTNSYYHNLVKPENRTAEEIDDFIKLSQLFAKHNIAYITPTPQNVTTLNYKTNNYACYTCHRLRPYTAFSTRQIRVLHNKAHLKEGSDEYKRRCIDCAIENGIYRPRTRIAVPTSMWALAAPVLQPQITSIAKFYCDKCQTLKDLTDDNPTCACRDCGALSKKDSLMSLSHDQQHTYHTCRQCENTTQVAAGCVFCDGPVCVFCGRVADAAAGWWCGRACSQGGSQFYDHVVAGPGVFRPKLEEIVLAKRAERKAKKEMDVFGLWEGEERCLGVLE